MLCRVLSLIHLPTKSIALFRLNSVFSRQNRGNNANIKRFSTQNYYKKLFNESQYYRYLKTSHANVLTKQNSFESNTIFNKKKAMNKTIDDWFII